MHTPADRRTGDDRRRSRRREQGRLRLIVERMADGVVVVGLDGRIRFANPAAEELFGRTANDLGETQFGFPAVVGDMTEIDVVRPGGTTVLAELRVVETEWEGEPARLVSLRDITDRKHAADRAAQLEHERIARAEAEAANRAKSQFLAMMSHELRTPLNAVIGYSELLDLGIAGSLSDQQRQQISRILAASRHLLGLVNEVLDLSKIEAGRLTAQIGVARAVQTADAALSIARPIAETRNIALSTKCAGDSRLEYLGDEERIRQIIVNLLTNAVKFTEPGGRVDIECGLTARPDPDARLSGGPWVYVRVADTGVGIAKDQLSSIFDPFVQVEGGHTRASGGSGLGLTISRRLARLMRGDITVNSESGKGSTFTVWLPPASERAIGGQNLRANSDLQPHLRGLAEIGAVLVRELEPLLSAFVSRLRSDTAIPFAHDLRFWQLADHIGTLIADIGGILIGLPHRGADASNAVAETTEIQRAVAESHGAQRAAMGWTIEPLRREWTILGEEIEQAVRRRATDVDEATVREAIVIIHRQLNQASGLSGRALTRALGTPRAEQKRG